MNKKPKRIQRKRTKGWRMPEGAVYVGRPTKWGNPFSVGEKRCNYADGTPFSPEMCFTMDLRDVVIYYKGWLQVHPESPIKSIEELRGKDLACWCPLDKTCHADILLELANKEAGA